MIYKLIIIGSGPAGLTAAIYAGRAKLAPLLFEGASPGGPLMTTTSVENYPGFPNGILGPDLVGLMRKQAERFGVKIITQNVAAVDFKVAPFKIYAGEKRKLYQSNAAIIATGTEPKKLNLASEARLVGRGISYCATCDGPLFKNKKIIVVGGGDSAMEEAAFLTKFASAVTIVVRGDALRASPIMRERVKKDPKIRWIFNAEVKEFLGKEKLEGARFVNNKTGKESEMEIDGAFIAIGREPNTGIFAGQFKMEKGYIITPGGGVKTEIPGVFAAGDVIDWQYRQAVTAAGLGCAAALEAARYLEHTSKQ